MKYAYMAIAAGMADVTIACLGLTPAQEGEEHQRLGDEHHRAGPAKAAAEQRSDLSQVAGFFADLAQQLHGADGRATHAGTGGAGDHRHATTGDQRVAVGIHRSATDGHAAAYCSCGTACARALAQTLGLTALIAHAWALQPGADVSSANGTAVNGTRCNYGGGYAGFRVANTNKSTGSNKRVPVSICCLSFCA